jgi:hypothetical protein
VASFQYRMMQKWLSLWESVVLNDEGRNKIRLMLDGGNLLFFFRFKNEIYGTNEAARVTYAKLRDDDDPDAGPEWKKEANFTATNLNNAVKGRATQNIFSEKDVDEIKIIHNKEEVFQSLVNFIEQNPKEFKPVVPQEEQDAV